MYIDFMVGEYMKNDEHNSQKVIIFYAICLLQGFINQLFQTSLGNYVFNLEGKEIGNYSNGMALGGVIPSGVGFVIS